MILWGRDIHWAVSLPAISALLAEGWLIATGYAGSSYRQRQCSAWCSYPSSSCQPRLWQFKPLSCGIGVIHKLRRCGALR